MPLGDKITKVVEDLIAETYARKKGCTNEAIQQAVVAEIQVNPKKYGKHPYGWPGLSAVQRVLARVRHEEKQGEVDEFDRPWEIGSLKKHSVDPDSIVTLCALKDLNRSYGHDMTIREAQWASRLYSLTPFFKIPSDPLGFGPLAMLATFYAEKDKASEWLHRPWPDTSDFDEAILSQNPWTILHGLANWAAKANNKIISIGNKLKMGESWARDFEEDLLKEDRLSEDVVLSVEGWWQYAIELASYGIYVIYKEQGKITDDVVQSVLTALLEKRKVIVEKYSN